MGSALGVHPEAPDSWRNGLICSKPAQLDHAYAANIIWAALNRMPLIENPGAMI
jgi:hypothetical protein